MSAIPKPLADHLSDVRRSADVARAINEGQAVPTYFPNHTQPRHTEADASATAVKARTDRFCRWFDVPPPKLKVRKDKVYMTDELFVWCREHGASLDWIVVGDASAMAAMLRFVMLEIMPEPQKAAS